MDYFVLLYSWVIVFLSISFSSEPQGKKSICSTKEPPSILDASTTTSSKTKGITSVEKKKACVGQRIGDKLSAGGGSLTQHWDCETISWYSPSMSFQNPLVQLNFVSCVWFVLNKIFVRHTTAFQCPHWAYREGYSREERFLKSHATVLYFPLFPWYWIIRHGGAVVVRYFFPLHTCIILSQDEIRTSEKDVAFITYSHSAGQMTYEWPPL